MSTTRNKSLAELGRRIQRLRKQRGWTQMKEWLLGALSAKIPPSRGRNVANAPREVLVAGWIRSKLHNLFEYTYHKAHVIAGVCDSPTVDQVKDLLEHAEALTEKAKSTAAFANSVGLLGDAGEKLNGAVGQINEITSKASNVTGDVSAACEISNAVEVLNKWAVPGSRTSNQDAARAFDKLFGGAARFMGSLPFPANQYARIFSAIAENSFFSNMRELMDPESPRTSEGRQLRELEKSGY